jgi:hypothetical protein
MQGNGSTSIRSKRDPWLGDTAEFFADWRAETLAEVEALIAALRTTGCDKKMLDRAIARGMRAGRNENGNEAS